MKRLWKKRQHEAQIEGINFESIEEVKEELKKVRDNWEIVKLKGGEIREKELIDYYPAELNKEDEKYQQKKEKILNGIKNYKKE